MKKQKAEVTNADALRLLQAGGNMEPSPERVAITLCVLKYCSENNVTFSDWNQPLIPALYYDSTELIMTLEEDFDVVIDDEEYENDQMKTFGDLVCLFEAHLVLNRNRLASEKAKLTNANCTTQTAFYLIRRRLLETGAAYYKVHNLRPDVRLLDVPAKHAEPLAGGLGKDYGLTFPIKRVLWGRIRTAAVQWVFFVLSIIFCVFISPYLPFVFWLPFIYWGGPMLCLLMNIAFGCFVARYSRYKWPSEYQTLGDVARKIAATADTLPMVQAAS